VWDVIFRIAVILNQYSFSCFSQYNFLYFFERMKNIYGIAYYVFNRLSVKVHLKKYCIKRDKKYCVKYVT